MKRSALVILALSFVAGAARAQEKEVINLPGASLGLPFSSAVRVGNLLFLSGAIGNVPGTRGLAPGGIEGQTRQTMENIKTVLEHAGSSMDRIVKCTVFLANIADYAAMNTVYASFFPKEPPARSTLAASGLVLGAAVEIECIALAGSGR
jgi:reactive intermediate/imine deaminase